MIFRSGLWGKVVVLFYTLPMQHCHVEKGRGKGLPRIFARQLRGEQSIWYVSSEKLLKWNAGTLQKPQDTVPDFRGERKKQFGSISIWNLNPKDAISLPDLSIRVFIQLLHYNRFKREAPTKCQFYIKFHNPAFSFIKLGNSAVEFFLLETAAQNQNEMRHQHIRSKHLLNRFSVLTCKSKCKDTHILSANWIKFKRSSQIYRSSSSRR